jgi:hypothetical protein
MLHCSMSACAPLHCARGAAASAHRLANTMNIMKHTTLHTLAFPRLRTLRTHALFRMCAPAARAPTCAHPCVCAGIAGPNQTGRLWESEQYACLHRDTVVFLCVFSRTDSVDDALLLFADPTRAC